MFIRNLKWFMAGGFSWLILFFADWNTIQMNPFTRETFMLIANVSGVIVFCEVICFEVLKSYKSMIDSKKSKRV